jgi:phage terminase small subunit
MPRASTEKVMANAGYSTLAMGVDTKPPAIVAKNAVAKQAWFSAINQLTKQNLYQDFDRHAVERFAILSALCRKYETELMVNDGIQCTKSGYKALSAEMSCFIKSCKELNAIEKQLSLTPIARQETGMVAAGADEFETWMQQNET